MINENGDAPTFTAEELALIDSSDDVDDAAIEAEIAHEDARRDAELRRLGLADEGGDEPAPEREPDLTDLADVKHELGKIAELRRTDRAAYFKDEKLQVKERELIEIRQRLEAAGADPDGESKVAAIDRELAEINAILRSDRRRYQREGLDVRMRELLERKERVGRGDGEDLLGDIRANWQGGGVEHHLAIAQGRTQAALGELRSGEAEALKGSFDQLPIDVQDPIVAHLGVEPVRRVASDATMAALAEAGHGEGLSAEIVGTAKAVAETMLKGMSPAARADAEAWAASLSPAQKRAVIKGLAGGRRR